MGVIGPGLSNDDTAADVRDTWRELVASGLRRRRPRPGSRPNGRASSPIPIGRAILAGSGRHPMEGRTTRNTRAQSCPRRVIGQRRDQQVDGSGPRASAEGPRPHSRAACQAATSQSANQGQSRVHTGQTDLLPGEVLAWKLPSGVYVLLWVVTLGDYLGTVPSIRPASTWRGDTLPGEDTMRKLRPRKSEDGLVEFFFMQGRPAQSRAGRGCPSRPAPQRSEGTHRAGGDDVEALSVTNHQVVRGSVRPARRELHDQRARAWSSRPWPARRARGRSPE